MCAGITINTDNTALARVNLDAEYDRCLRERVFPEENPVKMRRRSIRTRFPPEEEKTELLAIIGE